MSFNMSRLSQSEKSVATRIKELVKPNSSYLFLGNSSTRQQLDWLQIGKKHSLVRKSDIPSGDDGNTDSDLPPAAILTMITQVGHDDCFLVSDGNWREGNRYQIPLSGASLSFIGVSPTSIGSEFRPYHTTALETLHHFRDAVATPGVGNRKGMFTNAGVKFKHDLFEALTYEEKEERKENGKDFNAHLGSAFFIDEWPMSADENVRHRDALVDTHRVVPLPVYDLSGKLIKPEDYKGLLHGAVVEVNFTVTHCFINNKKSPDPPSDTYTAEIDSIEVLVPPAPQPTIPTKRSRTAGGVLPESPSKRRGAKSRS